MPTIFFLFFILTFSFVLKYAEPIGGEITVACETDMVGNIPQSSVEKALAEQLKNSKFSKPVEKSQRKGCYYTPIPRFIKDRGLSKEELTNLNIDKVLCLNHLA